MAKDKYIQIRVTEEEKALIEKEARNAGLPVSMFMLLLVKQFSDGITFERKSK